MEPSNHRPKSGVPPESYPAGPAIILVESQLGENIGMCARAMLNCGLGDLRLVSPRDGWPNGAAIQTSSGAVNVIENAKVFDTTEEAVADLHYVMATTARERDMVKPVFTPNGAADEFHSRTAQNQKCGILFGPERAGLTNDDVALAHAVLNVPLNPNFSSLNLAQAVLLIGFAWHTALTADQTPDRYTRHGASVPATQDQFNGLMSHLIAELEDTGFFLNPEKRPHTERNIRNTFARFDMTDQEVSTLRGIIKALRGKKKSKAAKS